ncbi:MAG: outer membrane beta-barrel protein [Candidatus Acidiferrales bacterium]
MKTIKIILAVLAFSLLAIGAYAQDTPKADVSVGYSYLHVNGSDGSSGINLNGFDASAAYNLNSFLGIVADFGVDHGSPSGVSLTDTTYTFGPRISIRATKKFVPFAEGLFGGAHFSESFSGTSGSANPFAFGFGGGVDLGVARRIALRPQIDYFGFRSNGITENSERVSISLVFNL